MTFFHWQRSVETNGWDPDTDSSDLIRIRIRNTSINLAFFLCLIDIGKDEDPG